MIITYDFATGITQLTAAKTLCPFDSIRGRGAGPMELTPGGAGAIDWRCKPDCVQASWTVGPSKEGMPQPSADSSKYLDSQLA